MVAVAVLYLREELQRAWAGCDPFAAVTALRGTVYRDKEGRRTLRFELGDRHYFLKLHQGVGWGEILKNLLQLRWPVLGATQEYRAIARLGELRLDTLSVAGFGRRGWNPARQLSFLITDELTGVVSLEDFCRDWRRDPPTAATKRRLIERVAGVARTLHRGGVNHRDFYLCHFMLETDAAGVASVRRGRLYLMDLHRAQIRPRVPRRWLVKDLGGLYYSALDLGLTRRDVLRFLRHYCGSLRSAQARDRRLWRAVRRSAGRIYRRDSGREPLWPR